MHLRTILLYLGVLAPALFSAQTSKYSRSLILMGSRFEIAVVNNDSLSAHEAIDNAILEIQRIESLISSHNATTFTCEINKMAGISPVHVPLELYQLIVRCKKISKLTAGSFDISYAVMDALWNFKDSSSVIPDQAMIDDSKALINYHDIVLNEKDTSVFLRVKGMKIGFGAIGKGYAANKAKTCMVEAGVQNGYVDASGDILFWGQNSQGMPWNVGIAAPHNRNAVLGWLEVNDVAVVTSGNYESFISIDKKHFSHILDPKTGWPANETESVTVVCPDAELADAMATAISVLGVGQGLHLVNKLKGVECVVVTTDHKVHSSQGLKLKRGNYNSAKSL